MEKRTYEDKTKMIQMSVFVKIQKHFKICMAKTNTKTNKHLVIYVGEGARVGEKRLRT